MFAKLLKHDFKSTWGIIGLLCLISLGAGVLGGGAMRYLVWISMQGPKDITFPTVLCILAMIAAILFIVVCGVAALVVLIARFYKSRFTDEGYLTFTLPVTSHQILLSSLVNSAINMLIVCVTVFVSVVILLVFGLSAYESFWAEFRDTVPRILKIVGEAFTMGELGYLVQMLCTGIVSFVSELVVLMLSVTIGALVARKHKILAAVGIYYGIHMALSIANAVLFGVVVIAEAGSGAVGTRLFGIQGLITLLIAVCGYFLMHYLVSKKLNLN